MHKEKTKTTQNAPFSGRAERTILIVATIINLLFATTVTIISNGSLFFYTLLHTTIGVSALTVLFTSNSSANLKRLTFVASILAALLALALTYSYLPGYLSYIKELN